MFVSTSINIKVCLFGLSFSSRGAQANCMVKAGNALSVNITDLTSQTLFLLHFCGWKEHLAFLPIKNHSP